MRELRAVPIVAAVYRAGAAQRARLHLVFVEGGEVLGTALCRAGERGHALPLTIETDPAVWRPASEATCGRCRKLRRKVDPGDADDTLR